MPGAHGGERSPALSAQGLHRLCGGLGTSRQLPLLPPNSCVQANIQLKLCRRCAAAGAGDAAREEARKCGQTPWCCFERQRFERVTKGLWVMWLVEGERPYLFVCCTVTDPPPLQWCVCLRHTYLAHARVQITEALANPLAAQPYTRR